MARGNSKLGGAAPRQDTGPGQPDQSTIVAAQPSRPFVFRLIEELAPKDDRHGGTQAGADRTPWRQDADHDKHQRALGGRVEKCHLCQRIEPCSRGGLPGVSAGRIHGSETFAAELEALRNLV